MGGLPARRCGRYASQANVLFPVIRGANIWVGWSGPASPPVSSRPGTTKTPDRQAPTMPTPDLSWLAAQGPPWWALILALLTNPSQWSKQVAKRLGPLLDRSVPGGDGTE